MLIGAETERRLGRRGVREFRVDRGGREAWLEAGEFELPREVEAVAAIDVSLAGLVVEFGSTPL